MTTDTTTTQRAQETAATAAEESKHVAGAAADQARELAAEATQQARSVVKDTVTELQGQLDDQGRQQKDRVVGTLSSFGDDLGQMAEGRSGLAADLAQETARRAQDLSRQLESREPRELLDDVRRFARERPGAFLLGALAAGVVVGRLVRGTKDAVEASQAADTPRTTPGAPDTSQVHASNGAPTQPSDYGTPSSPTTTPPPLTPPLTPPSATGYSSPPPGAGLPGTPLDEPGGPSA
jgi:hypothetical protein